MNDYLSSFLWNSFMILVIWFACMFDARGIDRDFKLRKKRPQVIKVKKKVKPLLCLKNKETRSRFPVLAVIMNLYGYFQLVIFTIINVVVYCAFPEYLYFLGDIISTVQIGIITVITLGGGAIMWLQRSAEL